MYKHVSISRMILNPRLLEDNIASNSVLIASTDSIDLLSNVCISSFFSNLVSLEID